MTKVAIIGSCVSRDAFEVPAAKDFEVTFYSMGSSVPAMMAPPVATLGGAEIAHLSDFFQRTLRRDFEKTVFQELADAEFDVLLVDLVEERNDLFRHAGSVVTDSFFMTAALRSTVAADAAHLERRAVDPAMFDDDFRRFGAKCVEAAGSRPVFLNACHFAACHVADDRRVFYNRAYVESHNRALDHYYGVLSRTPGLGVIDTRGQGFRGDPEHRWRPEPFHFEPAFYGELIAALRDASFGAEPLRVISPEDRWHPGAHARYTDAWVASRSFVEQGRFAEGAAALQAKARAEPLTADECHYLGRCLLELGDARLARRYLQAGVEFKCAEQNWAWLFLARANRVLSDSEESLRCLQRAMEGTPEGDPHTNGYIYVDLAQLIGDSGLDRAARETLSETLVGFWQRGRG